MIGGLMYLTANRPDIVFATFVCARYQAHPTKKHLKEVKRIFRYLRQSINKGFWNFKDSGFELIAYSGVDLAGCLDDYKSTYEGIQFLEDKLVSWSSKKTQLPDYGYRYNKIPVYCDSKSAIAISCNPVQHSLTKHINIRYHFIKDHVERVINVPNIKDTIIFKLDTQDIVYTVDTFRDALKLLVETPDNTFVAPVTIETIESFMNKVSYQGVVDKLIITDLMKKYTHISLRFKEDYHSIKDDIPLVSVYTIGNVTVRGMLIPNEFLTEEICAIDDYKEFETMFFRVVVLMNQLQPVVSAQGTHRNTPRAHRTPTLTTASPQGKKRKKKKQTTTPIPPPGDDRERDEMVEATLLSFTLYKTALAAEAQENIAKVHEKLDEEEIENMVEGEEDEESYASTFADYMLNDDVDDSGTRIEPGSHKENPKIVEDDDDVNVIEKEDDGKKDDIFEETDDAKEKDNDDHNDHSFIELQATGSKEIRTEKMQTPISIPTRSPKKDLSSDKKISKELTASVSPTTATTSKQKSKSKNKKGFKKQEFFLEVLLIREVLDHCNNVVPELTFAKTNEMIRT
ncbi:hypothetical protein Tco_0368651 [Tanacetum coccineum]